MGFLKGHKSMAYRSPEFERVAAGRSVLDIALDVHSTKTGSCERDIRDQHEDILILREVLSTWEPSNKPFDHCVWCLITAALQEKAWYE